MSQLVSRVNGRRRACAVSAAVILLSVAADAAASDSDWDTLRDGHGKALRAHAGRIVEIEGKQRPPVGDAFARAQKLTRERIAGARSSPRSDGKMRARADAAERASGGAGGLEELSRAQAAHVDGELREWGPDGPERKRLRESMARLQQSLERAKASFTSAVDVADAAVGTVPDSGASEALARIETGAKEAADRIRARWQNQQAALERERLERERSAAERARSLR